MDSDTDNPISGSDVFWSEGMPNPFETPLTCISSTPETSVAGTRNSSVVLDSGMQSRVSTTSVVTHTVSRPVYTSGSSVTYPGSSMGLNLPGSRPPVFSCGICLPGSGVPPLQSWAPSQGQWNNPVPFPGFAAQVMHPYSSYWNPPVSYYQDMFRPPAPPVSSVASTTVSSAPQNSDILRGVKDLLEDFKNSVSSEMKGFSDRLAALESAPSKEPDSICEEEPGDFMSIAPGSHERTFLSDEEAAASPVCPMPASSSSLPPTRPPLADILSPRVPEGEDSSNVTKDQLKARAYSLLRDISHAPMASPPRSKQAASLFETSCGLVQEQPASYHAFPESGHLSAAVELVNERISSNTNDITSTNNMFSFGPSSFGGKVKSKDFDTHSSSLGKIAPECDKSFSNLLGTKAVDGLRLSHQVHHKSEAMLRLSTQALSTAEHFLSAAGTLLLDKGDEFKEVKSFLHQVDQALSASQLLLTSTLANFTLARRREILEKASVSESLRDSLLRSPMSEKLFGLSLQEVQEQVNKTPQAVKVNVQVNQNGKRSVSTFAAPKPVPDKKRKVPTVNKPSSSSASSSSQPSNPKGFKGGRKQGNRK